ncbi:MAG: bacillithiol biosynthesis deacetylase BshB1 [Crocinitomicaceae bacterium]|nr:bacillithiol biosynthesis deacetylase BshB1 [Crocinitomicaceae bacterium]
MENKVDILAIGAHPDDVELSCGGTLAKHAHGGKKVAVVDLTEGELGSRGSVTTRYTEAAEASKILGIVDRKNLQLPDGFFQEDQESLIRLIRQIRYFQPTIILANAPSDRHPDHGKGAQLIARAAFLSGLRKIETSYNDVLQEPWRPSSVYHYIQDYFLEPDFVVDVTDFVEKKFEAIKAYKTQFYDPNSKEPQTPISGEEFFDFMKGRMMQYGRPIGVTYAEGFVTDRYIGVDNLFDLR